MPVETKLPPLTAANSGPSGHTFADSPPPLHAGPARPRIGVVGCGYWGSKHVRVLSGLHDVGEVAMIEADQGRAQSILADFPAARPFPDLEAALPHLDAVVVATPPHSHAELALAALRQGKHVLIEKPMATSLADARLLVEEARRAGVVLMVGHTFEFNGAVRELKRRLEGNELGDVYYIHSARLTFGIYRLDVNVVWDHAPHDIAILNYLLGSVPATVSAWGSTNAWSGVEDLAYVRLEYPDVGVTGYVHVSWLDPSKVRRLTVVGSRKMAVYNDMAEERLRIFDREVFPCETAAATPERVISFRYGDVISPHIRLEEPLVLEDQHFVDAIRTGSRPQTDGVNGLAVVAVLEVIDRSMRTGTPCRVEWEAPPTRLNGGNGHGLDARAG